MPEARMKPLFARVLVHRPLKKKEGSIIIPEMAQLRHASLKCKVLAVGPTADKSIQVGKWYLIGQHAGAWLDADGNPVAKVDGAEYFIVQDEDLLVELTDE